MWRVDDEPNRCRIIGTHTSTNESNQHWLCKRFMAPILLFFSPFEVPPVSNASSIILDRQSALPSFWLILLLMPVAFSDTQTQQCPTQTHRHTHTQASLSSHLVENPSPSPSCRIVYHHRGYNILCMDVCGCELVSITHCRTVTG